MKKMAFYVFPNHLVLTAQSTILSHLRNYRSNLKPCAEAFERNIICSLWHLSPVLRETERIHSDKLLVQSE